MSGVEHIVFSESSICTKNKKMYNKNSLSQKRAQKLYKHSNHFERRNFFQI